MFLPSYYQRLRRMEPFDTIEKLITEHGSAAILKEHVALLRQQMDILLAEKASLDKENATLREQATNLQIQIDRLKAEIQVCQEANAELRRRSEDLSVPPEDRAMGWE